MTDLIDLFVHAVKEGQYPELEDKFNRVKLGRSLELLLGLIDTEIELYKGGYYTIIEDAEYAGHSQDLNLGCLIKGKTLYINHPLDLNRHDHYFPNEEEDYNLYNFDFCCFIEEKYLGKGNIDVQDLVQNIDSLKHTKKMFERSKQYKIEILDRLLTNAKVDKKSFPIVEKPTLGGVRRI